MLAKSKSVASRPECVIVKVSVSPAVNLSALFEPVKPAFILKSPSPSGLHCAELGKHSVREAGLGEKEVKSPLARVTLLFKYISVMNCPLLVRLLVFTVTLTVLGVTASAIVTIIHGDVPTGSLPLIMEFRLYVRLVAFAGGLLRVSTEIAASPNTNDLKKFLMITSSQLLISTRSFILCCCVSKAGANQVVN